MASLMMDKFCTKCKKAKPLSQFHRQPTGRRGRHSWCKKCYNAYKRERDRKVYSAEQKRRWNLSTRYGLTESQVDAILEQQDGKCAICGKEPKRPCIDHNHETGKIRGILCHRCNIIIGGWDDKELRKKAMQYLGMVE